MELPVPGAFSATFLAWPLRGEQEDEDTFEPATAAPEEEQDEDEEEVVEAEADTTDEEEAEFDLFECKLEMDAQFDEPLEGSSWRRCSFRGAALAASVCWPPPPPSSLLASELFLGCRQPADDDNDVEQLAGGAEVAFVTDC